MEEHSTATVPAEETHDETAAHPHNDNAVIFGKEYPFPVYTAVYIGLAILTLIEITLSQAPRGFLTIPIMLIISISKAGLVVWFYMHLKSDSRIFALALLLPVIMVTITTIYLMLIPVGY